MAAKAAWGTFFYGGNLLFTVEAKEGLFHHMQTIFPIWPDPLPNQLRAAVDILKPVISGLRTA